MGAMQWVNALDQGGSSYVQVQGPLQSTEVSFVRIDPGNWKLPQDSQRVLSLVFQRSPIIIVVGLSRNTLLGL